MKRKMIRPVTVLMLLACLLLPAHAEEYTGSHDWNVTFDGSKIVSTFATDDLSDSVSQIQPGDTITLSVTLNNNAASATNWYMTNEVLKSLEDGDAEGGAYTYCLTYAGPGGETVLYDSDSVGGDDSGGLLDATKALKEYTYLDRLEAGASARVDLEIGLDGETQGNAYQDTLASLQMNFATEQVANAPVGTTPTPSATAQVSPSPSAGLGGGTSPTPAPGSAMKTSNIKTGDESSLGLWTAILVLSGAAAVLLIVFGVKNRKKEEEAHE